MIKLDKSYEIEFLDASRLSCCGRCEARYAFKYLMGLQPPPQDPSKISGDIRLDYGTIMHRVLPYMYDGTVDKAFEVFDTLWEKYGYGEEDPGRNTELSRRRMVDFIMSHTPGVCPYEIRTFDFSSPAELISEHEVPFLLDLGVPYLITGRIDAVVSLGTTGALWAYDFKTAAEVTERYFEAFWMAPQPCTYTVALMQIIDRPVDGLILEAMRISKAKKQEVGKQIETQLKPISVTAHNVKNYMDELKLTCARIEAANETRCWRQNFALCSSYSSFGFPCAPCEYKTICDSSDWHDGARFYEQKKPFNPLEPEKS